MDDLFKTKFLGSGVYGSSYLVDLKGDTYVLKREKLLRGDALWELPVDILSIDNDAPMWARALKFCHLVEKLPAKKRRHFMRLCFKDKRGQWRIINNCIQETVSLRMPSNCRSLSSKTTEEREECQFVDAMNARGKSPYCVETLLTYQGNTLGSLSIKYLRENFKKIALQLCDIGLILDSLHAAHRDVHPKNICINDDGVISLIDYGFVTFSTSSIAGNGSDSSREIIRENNFYDIHNAISMIYMNFSKYVDWHKLKKKTLPWEDNPDFTRKFLIKVKTEYPAEWKTYEANLIRLWPKDAKIVKKYFASFLSNTKKNKKDKIPQVKKSLMENYIYDSYMLDKGKEGARVYGWNVYIKPLLSSSTTKDTKEGFIDKFYSCSTIQDIMKLIKKIE